MPAHVATVIGILFGIALTGVAAGIWLSEIPEISKRVVPFSGGLLVGIATFWVLPEIAAQYGWLGGLAGLICGFVLLWGINRFIYQICPSCAHGHEHSHVDPHLRRFAAPLLIAASLHAFFDGWGLAVSQEESTGNLRWAVLIGIGIHKLPEGLALGALLFAATGSVLRSALYSVLVQSAMFGGALMATFLATHLAVHWSGGLLSVAAGVFVFLGYHAVEGQTHERGLTATVASALTGAAGAAALRLLPGI